MSMESAVQYVVPVCAPLNKLELPRAVLVERAAT